MRTSNQNEIDQLLSKNVSFSPSNPEKGMGEDLGKARAYDLTQPQEVRRLLFEVRGYLQTCLGTHCGTDRPGRDYAIAALSDVRPILLAVNAHDDLLAALKECAAEFRSEPCTLSQGYAIAAHEFQRRMEVARLAYLKATGENP